MVDTLCMHPRALMRRTLRVGNVIESIKKPGSDIQVYGPLLRNLRSELGSDAVFDAFGYDWRLSNMDSATELARFMANKVAAGIDRFLIIAHSMGGVVARLAFRDPRNSDLLRRVSGYVQIATPVRGSSRAYESLKRGPSLNPVFDRVRSAINRVAPLKLHDLLESMSGCHSLFQLLPPPDDRILAKESGLNASAFEPGVWPPQYDTAVEAAKSVHRDLQATPTCPHVTILSNGISTTYRYLVDMDFDIIRAFAGAGGDGTVCEHSASAGSDAGAVKTLNAPVAHDQLPNRASVFDIIVKEGWLGTRSGTGT